MAEAKKSVRFYENEIDALLELDDGELARVVRAILCECLGREQPELAGAEKGLYKTVLGQVQRDRELSAKQKRNGEKGGRPPIKGAQPKAEETRENPNETQKNPNETQENPNETQENPSETQENPSETQQEAPKPSALERRFNDFWAAYPKKAAKGAALKTWKRLKPSQELTDKMLAVIEEQKKSEQWTTEGGRYIPNPATWLNGERWDDELTGGGTSGEAGGYNEGNFTAEQYTAGFIRADD